MFKEILEEYNDETAHLEIYQNISNMVESGLSLPEIKQEDKKIYALITKLMSYGFEFEDISALSKEKILSTAIYDYIKSGQKLTPEMVEAVGFHIAVEESYVIDKECKEIIRLDCGGVINSGNTNLSDDYKTAINFLNPEQTKVKDKETARKTLQFALKHFANLDVNLSSVDKLTKKQKKKQIQEHKEQVRQQQKQIQQAAQQVSSRPPLYKPEDYKLSSSEIWSTCYSQFDNFRKIEPIIQKGLAERNIPPEIVKGMNAYDFQDIMFRIFRQPQEDYATIFSGSSRERVKEIIWVSENEKNLRQFMAYKGLNKSYIDEKVKFMKEYGSLCRLLSLHHIDHVKNAGKFNLLTECNERQHLPNSLNPQNGIDYSKVNKKPNLLLVSSEIHFLFHHLDRMTSDGNYIKIMTEKGKNDMILGVTDLFRTPYTGEKETEHQQTIDQKLTQSYLRQRMFER